jgi:hypothetical protein
MFKVAYRRSWPQILARLSLPLTVLKRRVPVKTVAKWTLLILLAGILLCAAPSARGAGFQPISPEELKMKTEPLAPGAPAIILQRRVDRDDNGRTSHEDSYFRIKILTEEGRKYADVEVPFFKESGDVVNVKARTIRPDGSVADFNGKVYEKWLAKGKGLKYLAKTFTLPDVQVGGILEYLYTIDLNYIYNSHWILSEELFTKNAQFSLKPYKSSYVPVNLRWAWQGLPPGAGPKEGPDHIVRMEANNIPAFQEEDFMPPANELKSRVDFIYDEDLFRTGSGQVLEESWEKMEWQLGKFCRQAQGDGGGSWAHRLTKRFFGGQAAQNLRPGAADKKYFVRGPENRAGAEARQRKAGRECRRGLEARLRQRRTTYLALPWAGSSCRTRSVWLLGLRPQGIFLHS